MAGLTTLSAAELLPLARSWIVPPQLTVTGTGFRSDGYDPTQRAWVVTKTEAGVDPVTLTFAASEASPLFDPAVVIRNWGDGDARLKIDGKPVAWGKDFRAGQEEHLEGTDLVVWIKVQKSEPMRIEVIPAPTTKR